MVLKLCLKFVFQHGQEVRASEHVTASLSKDAASGDGETTSLPDVEKLQVPFFCHFIPHFFLISCRI